MPRKSLLSAAVTSVLTLAGCGGNSGTGGNAGAQNLIEGPGTTGTGQLSAATYALFNPALSQLPIPNDILFAQETAKDGTMAGSDANPVTVALDFADGASTIAPIDIRFSGSLDPDSVVGTGLIDLDGQPGAFEPNPQQNVFLLKLAYPSGDGVVNTGEIPTFELGIALQGLQAVSALLAQNPTDVNLQQAAAAQVAAVDAASPKYRAEVVSLDGTDNVLRITPLEPLDSRSKYLVVVTDGLRDAAGDPVARSVAFNEIAGDNLLVSTGLEPLRPAVKGWLQLVDGWFGATTNRSRQAVQLPPISSQNAAIAYTVTTGGTQEVLSYIASPASFIAASTIDKARKAAINLVNNGTFTLNPANLPNIFASTELSDPLKCVNAGMIQAFTTPGQPTFIQAIADGTVNTFADLTSPTAQYVVQDTAAEVHQQVVNDEIPGIDGTTLDCVGENSADIETTAAGTILQLQAADAKFPTPAPREAAFYTANGIDVAGLVAPLLGLDPTSPLIQAGKLFQGKISLPYYLASPEDEGVDGIAAFQAAWEADTAIPNIQPPSDKITYRFPFPAERSEQEVPILVQVPPSCAAGGCPVAIFQHGIFGNRTHSIPLGNQLLEAGIATVAIDLPLHGLAPTIKGTTIADPFTLGGLSVDVDAANGFAPPVFRAAGSPFENLQERHFGYGNPNGNVAARLQYSTNGAAAVGASGENFINLGNLPVTRDNLRQAVVDLMNVNASVSNISAALVAAGGQPLNPDAVHFIGHSLGGIVGTTFIAVNNASAMGPTDMPLLANPDLNALAAAALLNTGGGIPRILENSSSIGSSILAGLAQSGLTQGGYSLEAYLTAAQGMVDSADPLNFAKAAAATNKIYLNEIYGDGTDRSTQDQTVPIAADELYAGPYTAPLGNALPAPLVGTEALIRLIEPTSVFGAGPVADDSQDVVVRFTAGTHTTIINPGNAIGQAVFADMARNIRTFFDSGALDINFNNGQFVRTEGLPAVEAPAVP